MYSQSDECRRQIEILVDGIIKGEQYAVECKSCLTSEQLHRLRVKLKSVFLISHKVFDTWGFRLGRVHKQFEHYGLYEQCLNFDQLDIQGKNCLAEFSQIFSNEEQTPQEDWSLIKKFLVPSHVTSALVGVCVPQVCNSHDLNSLGNTYLNDAGLKWRVQHCEKPLSFGNLDIFVVYVCLLAFEVCGVCPKFC